MIRYALRCARGHEFDSWFQSSSAYDSQHKRGLVTCPMCDSAKVEKAIMAPRAARKGKPKAAPEPVAAPAEDTASTSLVMAPQEREFVTKLKELRDHVLKNADNVGNKFPDEARKIGDILERIRKGQPLKEVAPELSQGVCFHVLGLAPNAARLSIRFWFDNDFGVLAKNYQRFIADMRIEPPPRETHPPLWRYLVEIAVLGKRENVPTNLAGEWMRSILIGTAYPLTLLSTVLMRIRADGEINALRVAILKALLIRNFNKEAPV